MYGTIEKSISFSLLKNIYYSKGRLHARFMV